VESLTAILKSHQLSKDQDDKWLAEAERLWSELESARQQLALLRGGR
jgi:hypothetical protein